MVSRRSFTREFKIETVRLATSSDSSVYQIASDMGIHPTTLFRWVKQFSEKPEAAFPGRVNYKIPKTSTKICNKIYN